MSRQKKIFIGFFTLCLMTAFSLSYISVQAEDFKGQEEKYIKLCSSSKLTDKQQKTCQEFNTYLKDKNKELAKDTKETQKNVKNTENTIQDIIKQMTDLEAKAASTQKELKYIQDSIESYNKNITKKQKTLEERMYAMQTTMNSGIYVSYLLGAEDFTDFMSRAANFKELTQYDNDIIEELTNAMKEVQKQQDTINILKESIEQDKLSQAELKEKFTAKLKEQNKELAANNAEVSKNQESIESIQSNLAAIKKAANIITTVKEASGNYGEFLRVDLTGDGYGDLGAAMQAVKWTYYGNDSTCTNALQTYGTKFAADNWMHKSMGIQLGLTKSLRCQLPEGYDGTGYWTLTVYALGYEDFTVQFQATDANIVKPAKEEVDTTALEAVIAEAKALKESDYTPASWVNVANELEECEEMLANIDKQTQNGVDEQITHLREAIDSLVKAEFKLNAASGTLYTQDKTSTTLKVTTNLAGTVTWKSSNTKVATVDSKGVVTAKAAGTANITATLNGKTATYKVTVKNAMSINKTAVTVYVGGTPASYTLKATSAIGGTVKYATSNKSVATVSSKGVVTAKKAGTAVITATAGKAKITCKVTVKNPSIAAKAAKTTIYTKGQTSTTIAVTKSGVSGTAKFTSSNKNIATVDSKGVVRAKKAGTVKITVQVGKLKKVVTVSVKNASLKLSRTAATINRGKTTTIKVSAVPTGKVTYTSSNKGVATVTSKGVVKGVKKGTVVITVKCSGMTAKFKVTVK